MIKTHLGLQKKKEGIIHEKNNVYKSYRNSKNNNDTHYLRRLKVVQEDLHNAIEVSKLNYYSRITYQLINSYTKKYKILLDIIKKVFQ